MLNGAVPGVTILGGAVLLTVTTMLRGRATTTTVFESSLSLLCLRALFTCQNRRMEICLACTEESSPAPAIVL